MTVSGFLGRALMDPATGLPNLPYFSIIRDWEERRARRRGYSVRVLRVEVECEEEALGRSLGWRFCQELRTSDLIASEGCTTFRILLTSPDAENANSIKTRIEDLGRTLNIDHPEAALRFEVTMDVVPAGDPDRGPCAIWDETTLGNEID